jgi:hypothetical protein
MSLLHAPGRERGSRHPALLLLLAPLAACAGPGPYATLSQGGQAYATAAEQVLGDYRDTYLDARSEAALDRGIVGATPGPTTFDRSLCRSPEQGAARPATPLPPFADGQCNDVLRVRTVSLLIAHMRLLGRYFGALGDLASSDAPAQAEASANRIVASLTEIGGQLDPGGRLAALPPLARAALGGMQRAALRAELERRGDTIRRELRTEARLLDWLKQKSRDEQDALFNLRFQRRVVDPVASRRAHASGDQWAQDRRALMLQVDQTASIEAAERALKSLNDAFETLLQGGDADQQLGQLIADVNLMLDIAEPLVGRK